MAAICPLFHLKLSPGALLDAAFRNTHALQDGAQSARAEGCVFKVLLLGSMVPWKQWQKGSSLRSPELCFVLIVDDHDAILEAEGLLS